jgi:hypothetical protein
MRLAAAFLLALVFIRIGSAAGQQPQPILPDPRLTPGDVFDVMAADVCTPGYSRKVRNVPESIREQVYRAYGITVHHRSDYELDHRAT